MVKNTSRSEVLKNQEATTGWGRNGERRIFLSLFPVIWDCEKSENEELIRASSDQKKEARAFQKQIKATTMVSVRFSVQEDDGDTDATAFQQQDRNSRDTGKNTSDSSSKRKGRIIINSLEAAESSFKAIRGWLRVCHGFSSWSAYTQHHNRLYSNPPKELCLDGFDLVRRLE